MKGGLDVDLTEHIGSVGDVETTRAVKTVKHSHRYLHFGNVSITADRFAEDNQHVP